MSTMKVIRKRPSKKDAEGKHKILWIAGHWMTLTLGALYVVYALVHAFTIPRRRSWKTAFLTKKFEIQPVTWKNSTWRQYLFSWSPEVLYQGSLFGVLLSYSITEFQKWSTSKPSFYDLISSENFQGILMALLWVISRRSSFKLLPFIIVSYLHISNKNAANTENLNDISVKNAKLLHVMAYSEVITLVTLLVNTLIFKEPLAGYLLVSLVAIFWLRVNFSAYAQATVLKLVLKVDKKIPEGKRKKWDELKSVIYDKMKSREMMLEKSKLVR